MSAKYYEFEGSVKCADPESDEDAVRPSSDELRRCHDLLLEALVAGGAAVEYMHTRAEDGSLSFAVVV